VGRTPFGPTQAEQFLPKKQEIATMHRRLSLFMDSVACLPSKGRIIRFHALLAPPGIADAEFRRQNQEHLPPEAEGGDSDSPDSSINRLSLLSAQMPRKMKSVSASMG
jgi:hypothetical protein